MERDLALSRFGRTRCRFCREGIKTVDYKDVENLRRLLTATGKIFSRKRSGNCARHQRQVRRAVKLARFLGLLPYVGSPHKTAV
jgi:small subunit ribosomal protein S18